MDFKLKFNMDNDAFTTDPEYSTSQILRKVASQVDSGRVFGTIIDVNGNKVGDWEFTE